MTPYSILRAVDGVLQMIGPFSDWDAALNYGMSLNIAPADWCIAQLTNPHAAPVVMTKEGEEMKRAFGTGAAIHFLAPHGKGCCGCWNLLPDQTTQQAVWRCNECGETREVEPPPEPTPGVQARVAEEPEADHLRDLLREAALQIEYLHAKFQETGSGNAVLARIAATIPLPVAREVVASREEMREG
jgi:hypothetical protein